MDSVFTVPGFSSDPMDLPVSMDPVLAVPGFPQIQWIFSIHGPCVHSSSRFASIHEPCVSSSRVSTYPADLPVSMDPVLAVPGVSIDPADLPVSMDPVFPVPGLLSIPTVDTDFNNPCVSSSWGFHTSSGFASLHTVPGLSSIPTADAGFNNPCDTSSWGFHRSRRIASLHGPRERDVITC